MGGPKLAATIKTRCFCTDVHLAGERLRYSLSMLSQLWPQLKCMVLYFLLVVSFAFGVLLKAIPILRGCITRQFNKITDIEMKSEDYWDSLFSIKMFQAMWHFSLLDLNRKARLGGKAYNSPVFSPDGRRSFHLLDLMKAHRPLVVNFGSCS